MPRRSFLQARVTLLPALLVVTFGVTAAADPETNQRDATTPTPAPMAIEGPDRAFLEAINKLRSRQQSPPLRLSRPLSAAARVLLDRALLESATNSFDADARLTREDLRASGYEPNQFADGLASSTGAAADLIASWQLADPASLEIFLAAELHDFGLATVTRAGLSIYALVAATSLSEINGPIIRQLSDLDQVRQHLLERVNAERGTRGLKPLQLSQTLNLAAQAYADRMIKEGFYGHISPAGDTVLDRVTASGYEPRVAGENLASGPRTPGRVMDEWMASEAHRQNILHRQFREIGFGVSAVETDGELKVLWVQCFGRQRPPIR